MDERAGFQAIRVEGTLAFYAKWVFPDFFVAAPDMTLFRGKETGDKIIFGTIIGTTEVL